MRSPIVCAAPSVTPNGTNWNKQWRRPEVASDGTGCLSALRTQQARWSKPSGLSWKQVRQSIQMQETCRETQSHRRPVTYR